MALFDYLEVVDGVQNDDRDADGYGGAVDGGSLRVLHCEVSGNFDV